MSLTELAREFGSDKWGVHRYTPHYERHFGPLRDREIVVLEIGIGGYARERQGGASLRMWKWFFPRAQVVGLDIEDKSFVDEDRITSVQGSQTNGRPDPANVLTGVAANGAQKLHNAFDNPALVIAQLQACTQDFQTIGPSSRFTNSRGVRWAMGVNGWTMFSTIVPPNSKQYNWSGCRIGCPGCGADNTTIVNATSYHPGGVNVVFGDGSVRFVKESVSQQIWWQLGTRAGSEVVSASSY